MKLILFDVDGTLVDSQNLIVEAQGLAFAALGLPAPSREKALSIVGLSLVEAFDVLTQGQGPAEKLAEAYKQAWTVLRAKPGYFDPLYPGAEKLLRKLAPAEDCLIGLATGKSRRGVQSLIERCGWDNFFATIQTADDAPSKPSPAMLLQACAETGVAPRDCVMIGDTVFDMEMARAAGAQKIGVAWGYHAPAALTRSGAEKIAPDFATLTLWLDEFRHA